MKTKEEFNKRIFKELKNNEIALINFNIYYNPDHIEYYENFHMEKYNWCYNYLMSNRYILNIKHTPKKWKSIAKKMIKNMNQLNK